MSPRARRVAAGEIVARTWGIWTDDVRTPPENIVNARWTEIVRRIYPRAVIAARSAFTLRPADGQLFTSHPSRTVLRLPGLTVHPDGRENNGRADANTVAAAAISAVIRIIIRTVLRNDYVSALSRATAGNGPEGLYRVFGRAQQWVSQGEFSDLETADRYLRATNATKDHPAA